MAKGDFDTDGPIESNADFASVQARQQGASVAAQKAFPLPLLGFVSSLNGLGGGITLGAGSLPSGVGLTVTSGAGTLSINITGIQTLGVVKCNTAAVAPGVNNDQTQGYARFSQWIDTVLDDIYACTNPATGAAMWRKLN